MSPLVWEILQWVLLALFLLFVSLLMALAAKAAQDEAERAGYGQSPATAPDSSTGHGGDSSASRESEGGADPQEELRRKEQQVRRIIKNDPNLSDDLARAAGLGTLPDTVLDDEMVRKIAQRISDRVLAIFEVASRKAAIDIDLESGKQLTEVRNGGVVIRPGSIKHIGNLRKARLTEFGLPRALRNLRLATGQAQMNRRFDFKQELKLLYVLEDHSGSMDTEMQDGLPRFIWSRGVVLKLALQALKGKTRFVYRGFQAKVTPMRKVTNKAEAQDFVDYATSVGPGGGGTNIWNALSRATEDIADKENRDITSAAILLISDGEDGSVADHEAVKRLLGSIELHVIMIGLENHALKQAAKTYQVFI